LATMTFENKRGWHSCNARSPSRGSPKGMQAPAVAKVKNSWAGNSIN
jgi:hypothetical protein